MTPLEKAVTPIAMLRPHQIWQTVARSDRQYLLIGDSDHGNNDIITTVTAALPALGRAGFRHLGLEREADTQGKVIAAFHDANNRQRRSGSDRRKLFNWLTECDIPHMQGDEERMLGFICAEFSMHVAARKAGIRPHPIRQMMDIVEFIDMRYAPPVASKYNAMLDYHDEHDCWPSGTTPAERARVEAVYGRYDDYNLQRDARRMKTLKKLAGKDRAIIHYGAGHFRRTKAEGMDKHLPAGSMAYVMVGARKTIESDLRHEFRQHRGSVPDFVVTTDTREGWVLPPARKNGLWHD